MKTQCNTCTEMTGWMTTWDIYINIDKIRMAGGTNKTYGHFDNLLAQGSIL